MKLLYSVPISGTETWLGLWAGEDYHPRSAFSEAKGRVQLRVMGIPRGGLHQRPVWPRRMMQAKHAIAFADEVKNTLFPDGMTFEDFKRHCEWQTRNFYFGSHA